jgi:hypothetical protein
MKTIATIGFSLLLVLLAISPVASSFIDQVSAQDFSPADFLEVQDTRFTYLPYVNRSGQPTPVPTPTTSPPDIPEGMIYVDHRSIELFERIPDTYLVGARNLKMLFADRSVGQNINEALECLTASSWALAPSYCRNDYYEIDGSTWNWRTFVLDDYLSNRVPERILFSPDPNVYNRFNWTYDWATGTWDEIVGIFVTQLVPQYITSKDVLSFQFSYLNIEPGSSIASLNDGFFVDLPSNYYGVSRLRWDISDLEALEVQYPNKIFIYWTTSLARSLGSPEGMAFNNQMRAYAIQNEKILFDVADILSHDDRGNPCFDNHDGIEYCTMTGSCENHPDDDVAYPAICQDYTTETDGGHLGSVSAGGIRVAKAFWVLMAMIAGWDG